MTRWRYAVSSGHIALLLPLVQANWKIGTSMATTLSLDEAALFLKTTAEVVHTCIRDGRLPAAKVGPGWVLVDDDILAWVRSRYPKEGEMSVAPRRALKIPLGVGGAPRDSIGTAEIAQLLGVSRQHVTDRVVTRPDFPAPVFRISSRSRRWSTDEVTAYFQTKPRRKS